MNTAPLTETSGLIRALLVLTALAVGAALFWPYSKITTVEPETAQQQVAVQAKLVVTHAPGAEHGAATAAHGSLARARPT